MRDTIEASHTLNEKSGWGSRRLGSLMGLCAEATCQVALVLWEIAKHVHNPSGWDRSSLWGSGGLSPARYGKCRVLTLLSQLVMFCWMKTVPTGAIFRSTASLCDALEIDSWGSSAVQQFFNDMYYCHPKKPVVTKNCLFGFSLKNMAEIEYIVN